MEIKGIFGLASVGRFWKFTLLFTMLCASLASARAEGVPLISAGSVWQYKHSTNGPGEGWRGTPFFTSTAIGWFHGPAPLGYGDPGMATVLQWPELQTRPVTAYFRREFWIPDASEYSGLRLSLRRDDGAIVYLNGTVLKRSNMPDGTVTPTTLALSAVGGSDETRFYEFEVPSTALRNGTNVMAVEVHQATAGSSDLAFDLNLEAELGSEPGLAVVSIEATRPFTKEPPPITLSGEVTLRRTGPTNEALDVFLKYTGTATRGLDFNDIPNKIRFEAGRAETGFNIVPRSDFEFETNETVIAELLQGTNGMTFPYLVDTNHNIAVVYIENSVTNPPALPMVTIEATRPNTAEPPPFTLAGVFKVRRSGPTNEALNVWLNFGGTATYGVDYQAVSNLVVIPAGEMDRSVSIVPLADFLFETNETVVADVVGTTTYAVDWEHGSAVVFIANSVTNPPTALNVVSIEATRPNTKEPPPITLSGELTLRRTGPTNEALDVFLKYTGTATRGVDFNDIPNKIRFEAGRTETGFNIVPRADFLFETNETLIAEVLQGTNGMTFPYIVDTNHNVAIVFIENTVTNPPTALNVVSIEATRPNTKEPPPLTLSGEFTLRRSGPTNEPLNVFLKISGTATRGVDYQDVSNLVIFEAGRREAGFNIVPLADFVFDTNETVIAEVLQGTNGMAFPYIVDTNHNLAVVYIENSVTNPPVANVVSIEATRPYTKEPPPITLSGEVTLRRTGPTNEALDVFLKYTGTATRGVDFNDIPNKIRFEAGRSETGFNIVPRADFLFETNETFIAEVLQGTNGMTFPYIVDTNHNVAIVFIENTVTNEPVWPLVSIEATRPNTWEPPPLTLGGEFTLRRIGPTNESLAVFLEYSGTATPGLDYTRLTNVYLIEAGRMERRVNVAPLADLLTESNETVVATLAGGRYTIDSNLFSAVVTIANSATNPPVVSIEATRPDTSEPNPLALVLPGEFTLRRSGPTTNQILNVMVAYGGTATKGVDYGMLSNFVTFQVGQTTAKLQVMAFTDNLIEGDETVVAELGQPTSPLSYQIDPDRRRAVVTIHDVLRPHEPEPIVLAVETSDSLATENPITTAIDPAVFVIRRVSGPTNVPVMAQYQMSGTASNGVDYLHLSGTVWLSTNQMSAEVVVKPKGDNIIEGDESVMITLLPPVCPTVIPKPVECYEVVSTNFAFATIRDFAPGTNLPPRAHIVKPLHGAVFTVGQAIEVIVEAFDPEGALEKVVITENGNIVGVSYGTNRYAFSWWGATVGQHTLVATATDLSGNTGRSESVTVLVREQNASAFVFRRLPDAYTPGMSFVVELRAEPPAGSRAYAVEDRPPIGWTVSQISHEGVFDAATGKVKFGPFFDANSRTLSYRLTPPSSATGTREFAGFGSIDGASYAIGGDRLIQQGSIKHPADKDGNWSIVLNELTAYAAAWKSGASWSNGPVPIPLSYVTRAGFIWKRGEGYAFNPTLGQPPVCWVPTSGPSSNVFLAAFAAEGCVRVGGEGLKPGVAAQMQINVTPKTGTTAYAVEERVPSGWIVANVSHDGTFDAATGTIRWGVFLDATARTLSYTVTPPANVAEVGRLRGTVSFDGSTVEITGADRVISVEDLPRLVRCEADASGVRLQLSGPAGQIGVLQRSNNLTDWEDVTTLFLPDGSVEYVDTEGNATQNFYRLQIR